MAVEDNKKNDGEYFEIGIRRLMASSLIRAIRDLYYNPEDSLAYTSAKHWVDKEDTMYIFSFYNTCIILGMIPSFTRDKIYSLLERKGELNLGGIEEKI